MRIKIPENIKLPYYFRSNWPPERSGRYEVCGIITGKIIRIMVVSGGHKLEFITRNVKDNSFPYLVPVGNIFEDAGFNEITEIEYQTAVYAEIKRVNGHTR